MPMVDLKVLVFLQLAMDVAIVMLFVLLLRRWKMKDNPSHLEEKVERFSSLLRDADRAAKSFETQLAEKKHLITQLQQQMDEKILYFNGLLNRAGALQRNPASEAGDGALTEEKIVSMARQGHGLKEIADTLAVPKEEVKLVLDLKKSAVPKA